MPRDLDHVFVSQVFFDALPLHLRAIDFEEFIDHADACDDRLLVGLVFSCFFAEADDEAVEIDWLLEPLVVVVYRLSGVLADTNLLQPLLKLIAGDIASSIRVYHPKDLLAVN